MFRSAARARALAALLLTPWSASAQQYVWSVPSADVLKPGRVLLEGYAYGGLEGLNAWSVGPRLTLGLGRGIEAGVNLTANLTPISDARLEVALKWQPWRSQDGKWALTGGGIGYAPLRNLGYDFGGFGWGHVSRTFGGGATVSVGGFAYSEGVIAAPARAGVAIAWEQPLGGPWTFGADWMSGPEGYTTAGFYYELTPALYASAGYVIGNRGVSAGNHYVVAALSWFSHQ